MPVNLRDSVVVITGASSGIGRATAHAFAGEGATVVLAARGEQPLRELAAECERFGGRALVVPTDVSDEAAVQALARTAIEQFRRVDVWVNNAAVTLFGRFEDTPPESYRRVLETNLFGAIHGSRAAMRIFRSQGRGVLINVSSVVSKVPQPYTSAYVISKQGIRALSESLRQELLLDGAKDIHVCTVMPASIDTPLFQHAANYTGRAAKPMPPVYPVEKVAQTIVGLAKSPRREVYVGGSAWMLSMQATVAPGMTERAMATMVDKTHLYQDRPAPTTDGNLFHPMPELSSPVGGWHGREQTRMRKAALVGLTALAAWAVLRPRIEDGHERRPHR